MMGREGVAECAGGDGAEFAYPYGRIDGRIRHLVVAAGYRWACTTQGGYVELNCDPVGLSRLTAVDQPGIDWIRTGPRL